MGSVNHVLDACGFLPNPNAEVYVDASKGYRGILDAATKLSTTGGTIVVGPGTFTFPAGTALQPAAKVSLQGSGRQSTVLTWESGHAGNCITQPVNSTWSDFKFLVPTTVVDDYAFKTAVVDAGTYGTDTQRIDASGGSTSSAYAMFAFFNAQYSGARDILATGVNCNGFHYVISPAALYNFGNSVYSRLVCFLATGSANKYAHKVEGKHNNLYNGTPAGSGSMVQQNLNVFENLQALIGTSGGGNVGLWLINTGRNQFITADIEGVETGIKLEGGIGTGAGSLANLFTGTYCNGNATASVSASSSTGLNVFVGGEITGTISDSGNMTRFIAVKSSTSTYVPDYIPEVTAGGNNVNAAYGSFTTAYKNWTGSTVPKGTIMRFGTSDGGVVATDATATVGTFWVGIAVNDAPYPGIVRCAVKGSPQVLVSNTVARNDILVVDSANAGKAKSNGAVMPTNAWEFLGYAAHAATAGQLCYVAVK